MTFALHPNLDATSLFVADLELCQVRLQQDGRFPWLVLIPRLAGAVELDELDARQQALLMAEISSASHAVRVLGEVSGRPVEKLNVGALGNVTPQLHIHVLGRRRDDGLWPDPVWGRGQATPLAPAEAERLLRAARSALGA